MFLLNKFLSLLFLQFCSGLTKEVRIRDGPPIHHARFMGQEIAFLQMAVLKDIYPMEQEMKDSVKSLSLFTVYLYSPLWFQGPFACDAPHLLLSFMEKVKPFERYGNDIVMNSVL